MIDPTGLATKGGMRGGKISQPALLVSHAKSSSSSSLVGEMTGISSSSSSSGSLSSPFIEVFPSLQKLLLLIKSVSSSTNHLLEIIRKTEFYLLAPSSDINEASCVPSSTTDDSGTDAHVAASAV